MVFVNCSSSTKYLSVPAVPNRLAQLGDVRTTELCVVNWVAVAAVGWPIPLHETTKFRNGTCRYYKVSNFHLHKQVQEKNLSCLPAGMGIIMQVHAFKHWFSSKLGSIVYPD